MARPTNWIEVDPDALQHNARKLRAYIGDGRTLWAVVKADAYGHGAVNAVHTLLQAGVRHFVVASLSEAIDLREAIREPSFRVMTLYPPTTPEEWQTAAEYGVESVIDSPAGYQQACEIARVRERSLSVHLELDTGMSRLGLTPEQLGSFLQAFRPDAPLEWRSVFTHFACADSVPEFTREQLRLFLQSVAYLRGEGFPETPLHAAASAA
ncbi:MAG: alanine racemase, partial [Fimbriimonadales bacterium]|nr:alanine racemase [Fimbriimonadales bacterium]